MAEDILVGEWRWLMTQSALELNWWKPESRNIPTDKIYDWVWIRVLGPPLHLWNQKIMKER